MREFKGLFRMLALDILCPLVAVQMSLHAGLSPVVALVIAALFPLGDTLAELLTSRRLSIVGTVSLVAIVAGIGLTVATNDARFAILKDSAITCIFGAMFLGSFLRPTPLIFALYHQMIGEEEQRKLDILWTERPGVRRTFNVMTFVWGFGLIGEAATRAVASFDLSPRTATALSPWISLVFFGGLVAWTIVYSRMRKRAALKAGLSVP